MCDGIIRYIVLFLDWCHFIDGINPLLVPKPLWYHPPSGTLSILVPTDSWCQGVRNTSKASYMYLKAIYIPKSKSLNYYVPYYIRSSLNLITISTTLILIFRALYFLKIIAIIADIDYTRNNYKYNGN